MEYMLLICVEEEDTTPPEGWEAIGAETEEWVREMDGRGVRKHGNRLRPADAATTVRVRDGDVLLTDGPFAETKEQIAGFDLLECASLDEALEVAAKHPMARVAMVEVRPVWDD